MSLFTDYDDLALLAEVIGAASRFGSVAVGYNYIDITGRQSQRFSHYWVGGNENIALGVVDIIKV
jgi:hypothetical protein